MNNERMSKDYIKEALLQLMAQQDYNQISITDITKRAGVNRVTFYRNYNSKEEIIKKILNDCNDKFEQNKNSDDNGLYQMLKYFEENKEIISLLYKSGCEYLLIEHILNHWNSNQSDENIIAYTKSAWAYFMFGWAKEWYLRGMKETPEQMISIIEALQKGNFAGC